VPSVLTNSTETMLEPASKTNCLTRVVLSMRGGVAAELREQYRTKPPGGGGCCKTLRFKELFNL
jgi:hypothetical protein